MTHLTWNEIISRLNSAHVLQTSHWADFKSSYGWQPHKILWWEDHDGTIKTGSLDGFTHSQGTVKAAASLLQRQYHLPGLPVRMNILYAPKGPLLDWHDSLLRQKVLKDLAAYGKKCNSIFVKIDPDVEVGSGLAEEVDGTKNHQGTPAASPGESLRADLTALGWRFSAEQVQFRNTVVVDLTQTETALLERMKQKTRYNVRLAERKGVRVRIGTESDIPTLYKMYAETSVRDNFIIRDQNYYRQLWELFLGADLAEPLIAEVDGETVAAIILFYFRERAWFLFGMSSQTARERMPNYLLQWEAIKKAKARGCASYDMWGAPDAFDESDPLWGVYRFKEGFNGAVVRRIGAWDFPVSNWKYNFYGQILPRFLDVMRRRGKQQTRQIAGA